MSNASPGPAASVPTQLPTQELHHVDCVDLEYSILRYLNGDEATGEAGRGPRDRYASFDYCFNYFQSFREAGTTRLMAADEHAQMSCLQLGFYLASWGMLRGSSPLLEQSLVAYTPVVQALSEMPSAAWEIDAHCYTETNIAALLDCAQSIRAAFGSESYASDTLVTKVMLGVFGSVPAFDTFVCRALKELRGVRRFGKRSLRALAGFYEAHRETIEQYRVPTLAFATGQDTARRYTRAKVLDMALFVKGQHLGG